MKRKEPGAAPGSSTYLCVVFIYPGKQVFVFRLSCCKLQEDVRKLLLRVSRLDAVKGEEGKHSVRSYPFVAVDKGVILGEAVSKTRGFLHERRIQLFGAERREGRGEGRFEKPFVTQPRLSACFSDKVIVQGQYLALA